MNTFYFYFIKFSLIMTIILFALFSISFSNQYLLYIFNTPINKSLFTIENNNIWVDKKVIDIITEKVQIENIDKYYDEIKKRYLLTSLCYDHKDKIILRINKETKIIDINTIRSNIENQNKSYHYKTNYSPNIYKVMETKYFKLYYTNNQLGLILSNLMDIYYDNILKFFGFNNSEMLNLNYKVPVYLAPTDDIYKSYNFVPDWSTGALVFDFLGPTPNFVIYAHERDSFLVQRVIPHEITHLILSKYWRENSLDYRTKFIQEGIAQYNEYRLLTGLDEIVIHPRTKISIQNLLLPMFNDKESIGNFYENSLSFTSFLICKYGKYRYCKFLAKTKNSLDIIKNLNDIYNFTLFYDERKVIKEIDSQWEFFIKSTIPTPLK